MRMFFLLMVFYCPSTVFAGFCGPPPAPPCPGGGTIKPTSLSADLSNAGALQNAYNLHD